MRKSVIATLFVSSLFLPSASYAVTPEASPRGQIVREEKRIQKEEKQASREARFCDLRRDKIRSYSNKMLERLSALVGRLEKLIERIEARIAKIEGTNGDLNVQGPKSELETAKAMLNDVKSELAQLETELQTLLTCEDPTGDFKNVQEHLRAIKGDLKEVHNILVHIIGRIKGLRVGSTRRGVPVVSTGTPVATPTPLE